MRRHTSCAVLSSLVALAAACRSKDQQSLEATCKPSAEVCNGLDDDCDGVIDGETANASCALANAEAACEQGACVVRACIERFGDCDLASAGCETSLDD